MDLKSFLHHTFGKDIFSHLKNNELMEERIRTEKNIERLSDDIKQIQDNIQRLMIESKGQPKTLKLLNIQKIKAMRLESTTKQQEARRYITHLQLLLLLEALKEHRESTQKDEFIEKILNSDVEHLSKVLFDTDVKKAMEDGKIDDVKTRLKRVFANEEIPSDQETEDMLKTIEDLESVDEETAIRMASEKAQELAETPIKKRVEVEAVEES